MQDLREGRKCRRWLSRRGGLVALFQCQASLNKRMKQLEKLATECSRRELAILTCAVEQLAVKYQCDAMEKLVIVQVVPCQFD